MSLEILFGAGFYILSLLFAFCYGVAITAKRLLADINKLKAKDEALEVEYNRQCMITSMLEEAIKALVMNPKGTPSKEIALYFMQKKVEAKQNESPKGDNVVEFKRDK